MGYRIGSFNLRDFNFRNISFDHQEKLNRNFELIADIIVQESFDVVALQEINSLIALKHLTQLLNMRKSPFREYEFDYGENMPTHSKDVERYGFIWNSKRLKLLKTPKNNNPGYYINAGGNELIRPPYYARFTASGTQGGSHFELRLVNTHIHDASSEEDRIREFNILVKQVLPRICDHRELPSDGKIMPAYTFLLGDYNLALNKSERSIYRIEKITTTQYTGKIRNFHTVQEKKTSLKMPGQEERATIEDCYANNYDHFTYELDLDTKMVLIPQRVEALGTYFKSAGTPSCMLKKYREEVSDHVPIVMEIDLKREKEREQWPK